MTCEKFREEIELSLDPEQLGVELREHLASCDDCREWYDEFRSVVSLISDETPFEPTRAERRKILSHIEAVARPALRTEIIPFGWLRYAGVAAVVVLSFVGVTGYLKGWFGHSIPGLDSTGTVISMSDTSSPDQVGIVDSNVQDLLTGADSESDDLFTGTSATGGVLDSLSADEVKYLEKNFDVREVL